MKRFFSLATALLLFVSYIAPAQDRDRDKNRDDRRSEKIERIHTIKVAYLTDKLHLTVEQAQQFWPLYNNYERESRLLRKNFFQKYKGADRNDDHISRQFIDDDLDFQAASVDLKRKYRDQFLSILSPRQLADLFKAEHDFNTMLMQRLKDRHNGDGGGHWHNDNDR